MAKLLTGNFQRTVNSTEADEFPLVLLEIDHPDLSEPVRVVGDKENIVSNGDTYIRFSFDFIGVTDPEVGLGEAKLSLDNLGREFLVWLETADWRKPTSVRIQTVRRSDPDNVEVEYNMFLDDLITSPSTVEGKLTFGIAIDSLLMRILYNKQNSPGLFP